MRGSFAALRMTAKNESNGKCNGNGKYNGKCKCQCGGPSLRSG